MKNKLSLIWVSNLFTGIIIGLSAGILGFIALGSILSFFSVPKPAIVYRDAKEWSLMTYYWRFIRLLALQWEPSQEDISLETQKERSRTNHGLINPIKMTGNHLLTGFASRAQCQSDLPRIATACAGPLKTCSPAAFPVGSYRSDEYYL